MIHQYYYHNNECKADSAESKDCICWHDEGTGQFVNERHDHKNCHPYTRNLRWRVKPDELADLKLRCEEQQQKLDEMAKVFSQQQDRIKRLEEAIQERDKEWFQVIESILGFHPVSMTEALHIGIERIKKQKQRIKRLEDAGDALKAAGYFGGFGDAVNKWNKAKEVKP